MNNYYARNIIAEIVASLDIPDSAYEKAEARYKDLGEWFEGTQSLCAALAPHIYAQGSFRLGTVVRPLRDDDEYDLDLGCRLEKGVTKASHSQEQLKSMVGKDLADYRKARRIDHPLEEKHRCWRLSYKDELSFHMDAVPSIPEDSRTRGAIKARMMEFGTADVLAAQVAEHAGAITDNRLDNYRIISPHWRISNSEGYAIWWEARMRQDTGLMETLALQAMQAKVDKLPARKWKSPLQRAVQILKRHRDVMFADHRAAQPISIIITTLAGLSYQGEPDTASALERILSDMENYINPSYPRVPNPVNPGEDFADKWNEPQFRHLRLEENFEAWLQQARQDFRSITTSRDVIYLGEQVQAKLAANINEDKLKETLGLSSAAVIQRPKVHVISESPAKPWARI